MKRRLSRVLGILGVLVLLPAFARTVGAVPLLQLDMKGGVYDQTTETIVAPGGTFTVYAILTPQQGATALEIQTLLNTKYFVSVALTPPTAPPGVTAGSFTFGQEGGTQQLVNVTSGMTYGVPPLESMVSLQGFDPGDLSKHGVFPTYFSEFGFYFSSAQTATEYNTQNNPGGPTPNPAGTSYYIGFTGNSSLLQAGYQLHFDLYNEAAYNCAKKKSTTPCTDVDVNSFAPFSHDAETTTQVPEPSVAFLMAIGLALGGRRLRQRALRG